MFMQNIPRRKIYEVMLEFEDGLIDMQILNLNEKNFLKYKEKFICKTFKDIYISYKKIKSLLIMFLENKKYVEKIEFENDLNKKAYVDDLLKNTKSLPRKFIKIMQILDKIFKDENINLKNFNLEKSKEIFIYLDEFNSYIPKILTIKRENLK